MPREPWPIGSDGSHTRSRSRRTRAGATVQPTPDVPTSRTRHLPRSRCRTARAPSPRFSWHGRSFALAQGPAVETTISRTWKQSPRRMPTFGPCSAAEIAADSLLVGPRWALALATNIIATKATQAIEPVDERCTRGHLEHSMETSFVGFPATFDDATAPAIREGPHRTGGWGAPVATGAQPAGAGPPTGAASSWSHSRGMKDGTGPG